MARHPRGVTVVARRAHETHYGWFPVRFSTEDPYELVLHKNVILDGRAGFHGGRAVYAVGCLPLRLLGQGGESITTRGLYFYSSGVPVPDCVYLKESVICILEIVG